MLLGQVYGELPFMILPLYVSLEKLDRSLLEAAADLGAAPARAFWRASSCRRRCRASSPGSCWSSSRRSAPFLAPDLLGGGRTMLLGNLIQNQFAVARDMPFGSALVVPAVALLVVLLLVVPRPTEAAESL